MARTGKRASAKSAEAAGHEQLRRALLSWYAENARDLPWRRTRDAYAIWVSEVMLQQTQVATVIPYFERWMRRFPSVTALAEADEHEVLHAWQGLGYYSRARSLLSGARTVLERHAGEVPADVDALRALPGVGPYTAGAIASIAHGQPAAIVDGNVERVLCRLFGLTGDPKKGPQKARLWQLARELVPDGQAGAFNQALMELGATVCTPKGPSCEACPWRASCVASRTGRQAELPETRARPKVSAVHMAAGVALRGGRVLVERLPDDAPRWAGLWQFPTVEVGPSETAEQALSRLFGPGARVEDQLERLKHSVTRYRITLDVFRCSAATSARIPGLVWKRVPELPHLAMPAAHRRIAARLVELTARPAAVASGRARARARP